MSVESIVYICTACGRRRSAHRCGCSGTVDDAARLLKMAKVHRAAAEIHPVSADANLRDAERLERLALQGEGASA